MYSSRYAAVMQTLIPTISDLKDPRYEQIEARVRWLSDRKAMGIAGVMAKTAVAGHYLTHY
jgi:hypothetical protein